MLQLIAAGTQVCHCMWKAATCCQTSSGCVWTGLLALACTACSHQAPVLLSHLPSTLQDVGVQESAQRLLGTPAIVRARSPHYRRCRHQNLTRSLPEVVIHVGRRARQGLQARGCSVRSVHISMTQRPPGRQVGPGSSCLFVLPGLCRILQGAQNLPPTLSALC